ncbi:MAG: hypothetical protein OEZ06_24180 [Myxococcales bacterium]|nr:hypothetical protein [Myxococcales bacterium]
MVTRTCDLRRFYLRPDPVVNQIVRYCLFRAAAKYGVLLHAVCFESNHFHLVLTDTTGRLDLFMAWLDRCIAMCLLAYFGEQYPDRYTETIWCDQSYNDLLLTNHAAVRDKLCYTVLNCVKDRLVDKYKQWPGVLHGPTDWLEPPMQVSRPKYFFDQTDEEHAVATGCFVPPPQFGDHPLPDLVEDFRQQLNARQLELVTQARSAGHGFVGVKKILATDPFDAPNNVRPKGGRKPTVAAGGDREAYKNAVGAVREYRRQYREAWQGFRRGLEATFPGGTLLMRHRFRQPCEPLDCWWCVLARCPGAMPPPTPS